MSDIAVSFRMIQEITVKY